MLNVNVYILQPLILIAFSQASNIRILLCDFEFLVHDSLGSQCVVTTFSIASLLPCLRCSWYQDRGLDFDRLPSAVHTRHLPITSAQSEKTGHARCADTMMSSESAPTSSRRRTFIIGFPTHSHLSASRTRCQGPPSSVLGSIRKFYK